MYRFGLLPPEYALRMIERRRKRSFPRPEWLVRALEEREESELERERAEQAAQRAASDAIRRLSERSSSSEAAGLPRRGEDLPPALGTPARKPTQ
jgi:hypothetical protein